MKAIASESYDSWEERLNDIHLYHSAGAWMTGEHGDILCMPIEYIMHQQLGITVRGTKQHHIDRLIRVMHRLGWAGPTKLTVVYTVLGIGQEEKTMTVFSKYVKKPADLREWCHGINKEEAA